MSDLLRSLITKERPWDELKKRANHTFALSLKKPERFSRKTDEQIPNPAKIRYGSKQPEDI